MDNMSINEIQQQVSAEVALVKSSIRCGYPDVGTRENTSKGIVKYTKTGLVFSQARNSEDDED